MMEKLLAMASRVADRVEIVSRDEVSDEVGFANAQLRDIESTRRSGVGLLLIRDGRLGYAYTRNLIDRDALLENALASARSGAPADYELSGPAELPDLRSYDPALEGLGVSALVEELTRACERCAGATSAQVDAFGMRSLVTRRVLNSAGADLASRSSECVQAVSLSFPGTRASIERAVAGIGFAPWEDAALDDLADLYRRSERVVRLSPGRMPVLFRAEALYVLIWRIAAATSGRAVHEGVSPLSDRLGERVFDEQLSIDDRPLDDEVPGARAFDDEGTPCRNTAIVDAGVVKAHYFDRYYAWLSGAVPTGHGYRGDVVERASPGLRHLRAAPGSHSTAELLAEMGSGVVVAGAMGAHSGNIVNGEYSVGLAPGLVVEGGEVVGRVTDAMVAGNVYETLSRVAAVGDELRPSHMGWFPDLLVEDASVSTGG